MTEFVSDRVKGGSLLVQSFDSAALGGEAHIVK